MEIEREVIDVDILIVGAGPAGLSVAFRLAELIENADGVEMPEIMVMDKGSYVGAHSLSGAVMDPRGLAELIPDFVDREAPLESIVTDDSLYILKEHSGYKLPYLPPAFKNAGKYIISLNKLTGWMAEQVEAKGLDIFAGLAGRDLVIEDGRVCGVQTVDMGLDKDGTPKSNFEPGSVIKAKVTVLCEGVHGSLTRVAFEKIPELLAGSLPQSYLTGVKEVWQVPQGHIEPGQVIHFAGWPQPNHEYGGGWVYGMSGDTVSVGFTVGLDSPDPTNDSHMRFQRFKTHPVLRKILDGGQMLHYGAKTIPVAGFFALPKLYHDGLLLCGDAAGMLNTRKLKGVHLAIKSGILAAETIFDAIKNDDYSSAALKKYSERFEKSWARQELYEARNFHSGFRGGLRAGMLHAGLQMFTSGKGLFDKRVHKRDHEYMLQVEEYKRQFGHAPAKTTTKLDNNYTFDKVTDVYKSGTMHEEHQPAHLLITEPDICSDRCTEEYGNPCQHFCPAHVYEMVDDDSKKSGKRLQLTPSNCVHCKTCDIADPYQVIRWVTPQGGEGPNYTNC